MNKFLSRNFIYKTLILILLLLIQKMFFFEKYLERKEYCESLNKDEYLREAVNDFFLKEKYGDIYIRRQNIILSPCYPFDEEKNISGCELTLIDKTITKDNIDNFIQNHFLSAEIMYTMDTLSEAVALLSKEILTSPNKIKKNKIFFKKNFWDYLNDSNIVYYKFPEMEIYSRENFSVKNNILKVEVWNGSKNWSNMGRAWSKFELHRIEEYKLGYCGKISKLINRKIINLYSLIK